jgi:hypothetical protein
MSLENLANRLSMITLVVAGLFFIYEGSVLVQMRNDNPKKVSNKVAIAGWLTIALGIISIGFAVMHLFFDKLMS